MNSLPTDDGLSSLSLKQMNRRKAKVVNPIKNAGSMKQTSSPSAKFVDPFDMVKEDASNMKAGSRLIVNHTTARHSLAPILCQVV